VVGAVLRLREVNDEEPSASLVSLAKPSPDTTAFAFLVGSSSIITALRAEAAKLLGDGPAVCLTGERGTGRAQIARTLAAGLGGRRAVQEVDCAADNGAVAAAAIRAALEQSAVDGGAVVLLHLDELSDEVCRPVVDLLADRAKDGVVFATAHDVSNIALTTMMAAGAAQLHAPPLRTRKEDIPALAHDMLRNHVNGPLTPSPRLTHALAQAAWPGNLDDLRGVLLASTATKKPGVLCVDDLGEPQRRSISRGHLSRLEGVELEQIRQALGEAGGNRVRAAEILEIGRSTLYRKIDAYNRRGFDVGP
jgi:sigma-54 dependent transcriptional regulator, acetoin dehydrogenase operon transcriptional activator AcoR